MTEEDARRAGLEVAVGERASPDSDLYRVPLTIGAVHERAYPSGAEYWDVELVDDQGVRRVCVRLKATGATTWRRCDPDGAPPPSAQDYDEETGEPS